MALIKQRLGIDATMRKGKTGQFEVLADGVSVVQRGGNALTRMFGAGYPDFNEVVNKLSAKN